MNLENVAKYAEEVGFTQMSAIETCDIPFNPAYRIFCEENDCGNYGKNYGCPPDCGTPQEMQEQAQSYQHALVFRSVNEIADAYDKAVTKALKLEHTKMTMQVMAHLRDQGITGKAIMAGPCNFCATCKIQDGQPCAFEELRFSCLSAYCIDAMKLAETCGMEMSWASDHVTLFSLFLYND